MGVVYKATNLANGKSYIGSTVSLEARIKKYKYNKSSKNQFEQDVVNLGVKAFSWEVVAEVDNLLELRIREIQETVWQDTFVPNGYNVPTATGNKCKAVQHVETGIVYRSITEATMALGISDQTLRFLCNTGRTLINTVDFFDGHLQWYED